MDLDELSKLEDEQLKELAMLDSIYEDTEIIQMQKDIINKCQDTICTLRDRIDILKATNEKLEGEVKYITKNYDELIKQLKVLRTQNILMRDGIAELHSEFPPPKSV